MKRNYHSRVIVSVPKRGSNQLGDNFRRGKCGKHTRSSESIARQKEKLRSHWSDPETRRRQRELTIARMARPGVSEKISAATKAALARPDVKQRQVAGLRQRYVDDPDLRQRVSERTKAGMARWRAETLAAAEIAIQQIPRAEREHALAKIISAASGNARR